MSPACDTPQTKPLFNEVAEDSSRPIHARLMFLETVCHPASMGLGKQLGVKAEIQQTASPFIGCPGHSMAFGEG